MPENKIICKQCAGCCSAMIVEIQHLDILREPRLKKVAEPYKEPFEGACEDEWPGYLLACGKSKPCAFLKGNKCEIYPTRPNVCVAFEPGSEQCKEFQI